MAVNWIPTEAVFPSPLDHPESSDATHPAAKWIDDNIVRVRRSTLVNIETMKDKSEVELLLAGGPRRMLRCNPATTIAGIVTCGGLCPGMNNVIRALVQCLFYRYKIKRVYAFRYGYEGLNPALAQPPFVWDDALSVHDLHHFGGTLLGTSRGPQPLDIMADYLASLNVNVLFTIGGDGTQRGANALQSFMAARGQHLAVIGVPKSVDNDLDYTDKTFGFDTAVALAQDALQGLHEEARAARNGIGIVKLMGRDSGCLTLHAALASGDANLVLLPEVPFTMEAISQYIDSRLSKRDHVLIVVSEGAGQDLLSNNGTHDASGNPVLADIGLYLKQYLTEYLKTKPLTIKYCDPSYTIRSARALPSDAVYCLQLAQMAVHAAMAGMTGVMIGHVAGEFVIVPLDQAVRHRKKVDLSSVDYQALLDSTGMPAMWK